MGLLDKLRGEFIDIIEWTDDSRDTIAYRFQRYGNEIKYNARLVVREGQAACFVNEGKLADVFAPGTYTLETRNLPILSTLQGWKYGFSSPFKAEVYFVATRRFTDQKWGTKNPFLYRDPELGAVRLRGFGTFDVRVTDPALFLRELVGTDGDFRTDEIMERIRSRVISCLGAMLGESKVALLDLLAHYDDLENQAPARINGKLAAFGLEAPEITIENISAPPEVEAMIDKRSGMGIVGNVQADMRGYAQFQAADSIDDAARNPGLAGAGIGMGAGFALGNQMAQAMAPPGVVAPPPAVAPPPSAVSGPGAAGPPPLPAAPVFYAALGGQQVGPLDAAQVQACIRQGELTRDTLVWKAGMANWTAAGQVAEVAAFFAALPPPLPPA